MVAERAYWLAWSKIPGIGPILLQRLHQKFDRLSLAWTASLSELATVSGLGPKLLKTVAETRSRLNPETLLAQHLDNNFNFWTPIDPEYPRLLLEIPSPPAVLYYRGTINPEENQGNPLAVGIVGTRNATEYGRRWTRNFSTVLARHGFTIVSGMARGIDTEAHRACLTAGGRTIAVLGTGIDVAYPASNRKLYEQIQEQGLILSDYPPGTPPDAKNFPPRNRIIAGLSRAVLVMEASQRSGASITARYATEFNRDVCVLPNAIDRPQSMGCLELANRGAQMILSEAHLLELLGEIPHLDVRASESLQRTLPELAPELATVFAALEEEEMAFEAIAAASGFNAAALGSALLRLELLDLVVALPGMRYRKT